MLRARGFKNYQRWAETVVGEHCFDVDLDAIETPLDAESSTNPTSANREGALG